VTENGQPKPMLRVVHGDPTPEEIAALVAVIGAVGSAAEAPAPRRTPAWSAHHRKLRTTYAHGRGGWRTSGLPR
jgi:hypothetical protein